MIPGSADRNLLLGILAYQNAFITKDQLLAGMQTWLFDKAKPLAEILRDQGSLDEPRRALLDALVNQHVQQHGGDAQRSLQAVSSAGSVRGDLEGLSDPDLQTSIVHLSPSPPSHIVAIGEEDEDPFATTGVASPKATGLRFRILRPHAKGGLGEVFVAHDEELHREVALKEIQDRHADNQESRARFVLEAEITGGLEHPGIVPVYGLGTYADGRPFYAMRFIRGDSLQDAIERFHKDDVLARDPGMRLLELRKLLGRFIDVCQAMQYAHDRGVLHRDLKPGNIMLGKYGETLVVDWGLAKAVGKTVENTSPRTNVTEPVLNPASIGGSSATIAGTALGTPAFMSPEQAAGRLDQLGPASDVYSLGATLYTLLTGKPSIEERDLGAALKKIQQGEFPSPRQVLPLIPPALEAICLKAMALNSADRFASPDELASDIEHWLADEPVKAWREPMTAKARRWMRRHKPLVTGVAVALLVGLCASIIGFVWYENQQVQAARNKASADADNARRQMLAEEQVHQSLAQARKTRDDLHKTLRNAGGVQDMLNHPERWQFQIKSARAEWQHAKEHVAESADSRWATRLKSLDEELARDQADYDLSMRLEKIHLDTIMVVGGKFDHAVADREYPLVFAQAGLSTEPGRQKEVARLIAQSAVKDQLLASLDHWAYRAYQGKNFELNSRLLELARRADPDPWRDQVRDPARWTDGQRLEKLAKDAQSDKEFLARLSPQMLLLVGELLPEGATHDRWRRAAQSLHPDDFWLNFSLARVLLIQKKGTKETQEAAGFFRAALAIRPNNSATLANLGDALHHQGDLAGAIEAYNRALTINPEIAVFWNNLGGVLNEKKELRAAIDAYNQALAIDPRFALAWSNLGLALSEKKDLPAAIEAYNKALTIDPKLAIAWNNLGGALWAKNELPAAIDAYQKAVNLQANFAEAHCNLGLALCDHGDFGPALKSLEEGHRLGSQRKGWSSPSGSWVKMGQSLVALDKKLPSVLQGEAATAAEQLAMADMCRRYKKRYSDAVELYRRAFVAEPKLADDLAKNHRYNAACAAVLASAGQGVDADKLDAKHQGRMRKQAVDWLQADLTLRAKLAHTNPTATVKFIDEMENWQRDASLASLRDEKDLAKLMADERALAQNLWTEVETITKQARASYRQSEHKGQLKANIGEQSHPVKMTSGKTYVIDMESPQFDTYLRLEDEQAKVVAENDDISPTNLNSRIVFTPREDGAYRIVATSFQQRGAGNYTITVREFDAKKN